MHRKWKKLRKSDLLRFPAVVLQMGEIWLHLETFCSEELSMKKCSTTPQNLLSTNTLLDLFPVWFVLGDPVLAWGNLDLQRFLLAPITLWLGDTALLHKAVLKKQADEQLLQRTACVFCRWMYFPKIQQIIQFLWSTLAWQGTGG